MNIIYSFEAFSFQRFGGIDRYSFEIIRRMVRDGHGPRVVAGFYKSEYLRGLSGVTGCYVPRLPLVRYRFNAALCRLAIRLHPRAVLHQTYPLASSVTLAARSLVITVYDMIQELFPNRGDAAAAERMTHISRLKRVACEKSAHIITISETTKRDLVRLFDVDPRKVTAIPLASSLPRRSTAIQDGGDPPPEPAPGSAAPYLLYVGTRKRHKNFDRFVEAYAASPFLRREFRVLCFGGGPFSAEEQTGFTRLRVADRFEQRSGDDAALAKCYQRAVAFVYPSVYEGFGLPSLEAMSQGCPVICSSAGSLPEVAGDAAVYFPPEDLGGMRETLEKTLGDRTRLRDLAVRGAAREQMFTWENCYRDTLSVYRAMGAV